MISHEIAQNLLKTYGSPLYVYSREYLEKSIQYITQSIPYPNTEFKFASVTNGNIHLLKIFKEADWGLHANTPGDVYLGLKAGFHPKDIVYSGSNLNRNEMIQILKWGVKTLNLDSLSQLSLCCQIYNELNLDAAQIKLGLRLNLPEITGDSRIGVNPKEFEEAIQITQKENLKLIGLHFYRGTGTNATQAFTQVIDKLFDVCCLIPDWQYLDFGGGFGDPYKHNKVSFNWTEFGKKIDEKLQKLNRKITLILEPGRAVIAGCGVLLSQVVSIKWQDNKQIIGVDTTVANISVPSVYGRYRDILVFKAQNTALYNTDVCGNTTYSKDFLGKNCQLPALEIGDIVVIKDVGAYGYAMSSHFLHRPLPAEVLLNQDKNILIRTRENYDVLLKNQNLD